MTKRKSYAAAVLAATLFMVAPTQAQERVAECDCTVVSGDCRGEVTKIDGRIRIDTNTRQCARVTWRAGEESFITIVPRRREIVEQAESFENASLSVSSCEVCQVSGTTRSTAQPSPNPRPRAADDISQKALNNCNDQIAALRDMLARTNYENPMVRSRCTQLRNNCPAGIVGEVAVRRFSAVCEGNAPASSLIRGQ